jgi:drug/metabolite transporter (DMT)-like permease
MPILYSLLAVLCWGTSDFTGGYASKRSDAFVVTLVAHASGTALMLALAIGTHAPFLSRESQLWALAAGAMGGVALAIFYRALAGGKMGLTAPIAALLGAAIPTGFAMLTEGLPGKLPMAGFLLAALGIWLISRPEGNLGRPEGLSMAILSGIGFAAFILCIHRVGDSSVLWSAAHSRFASFVCVGVIVLARRGKTQLNRNDLLLGLFAGCLDVTGTALFIRANQIGRLDSAVVITALYPAVTVILARLILKEHFHRWRALGILAALIAVPLIALQ